MSLWKWIIKLLFGGTETGSNDDHVTRVITAIFQVSGHWRKQWVGSSKDGTRHSIRKWIEPFVKGE